MSLRGNRAVRNMNFMNTPIRKENSDSQSICLAVQYALNSIVHYSLCTMNNSWGTRVAQLVKHETPDCASQS